MFRATPKDKKKREIQISATDVSGTFGCFGHFLAVPGIVSVVGLDPVHGPLITMS